MLEQALLTLSSGGVWALAALVAAEYLGIPLPTELAYLAGYHLVEIGKISFFTLFIAIMVAHIIGSLTAYEIGYRASFYATKKPRLDGIQKKLNGWYARYGPITVLATQLIGHVRPWASYVAGFSRIPRGTFVVFNTIGSAVLTLIMLIFSQTILDAWRAYPFLRGSIVSLFVLIFAGLVFYWISDGLKKSRKSHQAVRSGKSIVARKARRQ
jgi:membrane protein DedA with SNARE-associated domain